MDTFLPMESSSDNRLAQVRKRFGDAGLRFTEQRKSIWELFAARPKGLTIAEAVGELKDAGIGQATVYRTVRELRQFGFLQWVHEESGEHRFVACVRDHCHHMVCRNCGNVAVFDCRGVAMLEDLVSLQTGFSIEGHLLEFYGLCPECRENESRSAVSETNPLSPE
jgi:Fur family transcriptional regulator, ferric uptake regulator